MSFKSFTYKEIRSETSRDSNSQTETISFDGTLLMFSEQWDGYHPAGGGGSTLPFRYKLNPSLLQKLEQFLKERGFLDDQENPSVSAPQNPEKQEKLRFNDVSRTFTQSLELKTEKKDIKIHLSSASSEPGSKEQESDPNYAKLRELKSFLNALRFEKGSELVEYSQKERDDHSFKKIHGHYPDEKPSSIGRFYLTKYEVQQPTKSDYKTLKLSYTFDGFDSMTEHQVNSSRKIIVNEEFKSKLLSAIVKTKLYALKSPQYLSPADPMELPSKVMYELHADFGPSWSIKTGLTFYDSKAARELDAKKDNLISRFEEFEKEFIKIAK